MFRPPEILAGGNIFDWSSLLPPHNLFLAVIASIVIFCMMVRRRERFDGPYFSGLFVLALVPFMASALYGALVYREFLEAGWLHEPQYTLGRLKGPTQFMMFGWWTTVVAVGVYSVLYVMNRRKRLEVRDARDRQGEPSGEEAR